MVINGYEGGTLCPGLVSSEEQAKHGLSIETQLDNLREWSSNNKHTIVAEYVDAGISGKKPYTKRPELSRFMNDLEAGMKVDALVFVKLDRFFRSVKLYYQAADILDKYKVAWVAIHERYETLTSQGRFIVNLFLSLAEQEADRTGERVSTVISHKFAKGEWSGKPPRGYSVVNKKLEPNKESPIIEGAFNACLLSGSVVEARKHLVSNGINVTYNTAYRIVTNPIYIGSHNGNPNFCKPTVSKDVFDEIQSFLGKRSVRTNTTGRIYIFSGLVHCADCGWVMTGHCNTTYSPGKMYRYRCNNHFNNRICQNGHYVIEYDLEEMMLTKVEAEMQSSVANSETKPKKKASKPVDNSKKIERLTELYIDGHISKEEYQKRREALAIPQQTTTSSKNKIIALSGLNFRESYQSFTRQQKRAFWKSVVDRIVTDGENFNVIFRS